MTADRTPTWPRVTPYAVQGKAVDACEMSLAEHGSSLLVLPTGTGKTICFAELARRYWDDRGERVLVIAHRQELVRQAADKIERYAGLQVGIEMSTEKVDSGSLFCTPPVVIGSVQSFNPSRLARYEADAFGLVIIDEAHHSIGKTYRRVIDHFRGSVFDASGIVRTGYDQSTHLLGVTATPDRADRRALGDVFADVAYTYELRDAIDDGHLVPMQVITAVMPELDLSGVRKVAGDFNQGQLDDALKPALQPAAVKVAVHAGVRPTMAFLPSVATAHAFASYLRAEGMTALALDGTSAPEDRRDTLRKFRSGEVQCLCNCALFTEGFDEPSISCVAILRPTMSRTLYAQMIGRGTRLAPGKGDLLVLDMPGVGCDDRMQLVTPADVLGGITDDDVRRKARELLAEAGLETCALDELIDRAEAAVTDDRERAAAKQLRRGRKAEKLDILGSDGDAQRPRWMKELSRFGLTDSEVGTDEERGQQLIAACRHRRSAGLCSWKQAKLLTKRDLPTTAVTFEVAHRWIDDIASRRWGRASQRVHDEAEKYWPMDRRARP